MGAGVSGQPVYLTRSTMLISHTPVSNHSSSANPAQCTFRRHSTIVTAPGASSASGISSQLAFPIQLYPNNVYNNHGHSAQVHGFEPHPSPPTSAPHSTIITSLVSPATRPSAPSDETPPPYSSIYPNLARVN